MLILKMDTHVRTWTWYIASIIIAKWTWCLVYCCLVYIATIKNGHSKVNLVYEGGEESVLGSLQVKFFHLRQKIASIKSLRRFNHATMGHG